MEISKDLRDKIEVLAHNGKNILLMEEFDQIQIIDCKTFETPTSGTISSSNFISARGKNITDIVNRHTGVFDVVSLLAKIRNDDESKRDLEFQWSEKSLYVYLKSS